MIKVCCSEVSTSTDGVVRGGRLLSGLLLASVKGLLSYGVASAPESFRLLRKPAFGIDAELWGLHATEGGTQVSRFIIYIISMVWSSKE